MRGGLLDLTPVHFGLKRGLFIGCDLEMALQSLRFRQLPEGARGIHFGFKIEPHDLLVDKNNGDFRAFALGFENFGAAFRWKITARPRQRAKTRGRQIVRQTVF